MNIMKRKIITKNLYIDTSIHGGNNIYVMSTSRLLKTYTLIDIETGTGYTSPQKTKAKAFGGDRADFERFSKFKVNLKLKD